jgi:hypothetical protein
MRGGSSQGIDRADTVHYLWSMERIYYAGDHFLTGTEIARALVAYAAALATRSAAGTIDIPVRHEDDGTLSRVRFLVGPASQLVTEAVDPVGYDEIEDPDVVARLQALTAELAPMHPVPNHSADRNSSVDYDWTDEV